MNAQASEAPTRSAKQKFQAIDAVSVEVPILPGASAADAALRFELVRTQYRGWYIESQAGTFFNNSEIIVKSPEDLDTKPKFFRCMRDASLAAAQEINAINRVRLNEGLPPLTEFLNIPGK